MGGIASKEISPSAGFPTLPSEYLHALIVADIVESLLKQLCQLVAVVGHLNFILSMTHTHSHLQLCWFPNSSRAIGSDELPKQSHVRPQNSQTFISSIPCHPDYLILLAILQELLHGQPLRIREYGLPHCISPSVPLHVALLLTPDAHGRLIRVLRLLPLVTRFPLSVPVRFGCDCFLHSFSWEGKRGCQGFLGSGNLRRGSRRLVTFWEG